jgi:hypothetical protein
VFVPEVDIDAVLEAAHQIRRDDADFRSVISRENGDATHGTER